MSKKIPFVTKPVLLDNPEAQGKFYGVVQHGGTTADLDAVAARAAKDNPALTKNMAKLIIRSLGEVLRNALEEGHSVDTPWGYITCNIQGSLPTMDAAVSAENALVADFINSYETIGFADLLRGTNVSASSGALSVNIDTVEDALTKRKGVIVGTSEFVLTGKNLSGDGESLSLQKLDGTLAATCSVTGGDGLGQRISARLATAVTPGKYRLALVTHGYSTPSAPIQTVMQSVEVVAA